MTRPQQNKIRLLRGLNQLGPFLGLLMIYGLLVAFGPDSFGTVRTLETIARQTAIVGAAALGMTLVIILGGIDLSTGSVVALCTVITAKMLAWFAAQGQSAASSFDVLLLEVGLGGVGTATAVTLAIALFCGGVNGLIITRFKVVPFIVTLGTLLVIRGAVKGLANQQKVDAPFSCLNELLAPATVQPQWAYLAPGVWVLIVLAIATFGLLNYTQLGKHIYAIGSNEQAARLCGVAVEKVKRIVYTIAGFMAGVAGILQFSRLSVGDPTVAAGLELDVIAAVVIGGGSLSGGEGSVVGTIVGALIMTVIRSGCSQMGLPNWIQEIVTGAIIVLAVAIDRLRHRMTQ